MTSEAVTDCPSCGKQPPAGSLFCPHCGNRLQDLPDNIEQANPRSYIPSELASKMIRARKQLEGERRTVSVLFADAVGSTANAERLDDEVVYRIVQDFIAIMTEAVHRYEGTVTQFRGDGIMALFGAPIANEDSARRAVAAGLKMQRGLQEYEREASRKYGAAYQFRVGINTGSVVVGSISDNLSMDYTAIGDTANLAARMEQTAEPGSVRMSEDTLRAVVDYFDVQDTGEVKLKGKSRPVRTYSAIRERAMRTRFEAAVERGLTPLVGRADELAELRAAYVQAAAGRGAVVAVFGEAGIGKSRLLLEFHRFVEAGGGRWVEGHCISFGRNFPYLPLIDLVRRSLNIAEGDSESMIIDKCDRAVSAWSEVSRAGLPFLKLLLNVDPGDPAVARLTPQERESGIFEALQRLVEEEASRHALALIIEDLHWIDDRSRQLVGRLASAVTNLPAVMILTHRPEFSADFGETAVTRIRVAPLPQESASQMADRVLGRLDIPQGLRELIVSRADGNPFYIEEVAKALVEMEVLQSSDGKLTLLRPVEEIRVPETLQEVILARIDRLDGRSRRAIQLASVIGREFTARLLDRISDMQAELDEVLAELNALELIFPVGGHNELAYMFKHALTHDVAYGTLLVDRRKALHRLVAQAVEELYVGRSAEQYETLAHHYHRAEEWPKALEYLIKAGEKAAALYANTDAAQFFGTAMEVAKKIGDIERYSHAARSRGFINFATGALDEASADFKAILETGRSMHDSRMEGMSLTLLGMVAFLGHDSERAEQYLREAHAIGQAQNIPEVTVAANIWLVEMLSVLGRHEEAAPIEVSVEGSIDAVQEPSVKGFWGMFGLFPKQWRGDFESVVAHLDKWHDYIQAIPSPTFRAGEMWGRGLALGGHGEYQRAIDIVLELNSYAERSGEVFMWLRSLNTLGWLYGEILNYEQAMQWNTKGVNEARRVPLPDPEVLANALLNLADNYIETAELGRAEEPLKEVEQWVMSPTAVQQFMLWRYAQHFFHSRGLLRLLRGDSEAAFNDAQECLDRARSSGSRKNVVKALRLKGQALQKLERKDAAGPLEEAVTLARELGNPVQLWRSLAAAGDRAGAVAVMDRVATSLIDEGLKRGLLASNEYATTSLG